MVKAGTLCVHMRPRGLHAIADPQTGCNAVCRTHDLRANDKEPRWAAAWRLTTAREGLMSASVAPGALVQTQYQSWLSGIDRVTYSMYPGGAKEALCQYGLDLPSGDHSMSNATPLFLKRSAAVTFSILKCEAHSLSLQVAWLGILHDLLDLPM